MTRLFEILARLRSRFVFFCVFLYFLILFLLEEKLKKKRNYIVETSLNWNLQEVANGRRRALILKGFYLNQSIFVSVGCR